MLNKSEVRSCVVNNKSCLFHKWSDVSYVVAPSMLIGGHNGGQFKHTIAIIEHEDGTIHECKPTEVKFIDRKRYNTVIKKPIIDDEKSCSVVGVDYGK